MRKIKAVLDTNAWASGVAFKRSIGRKLLEMWEADKFEALVSKEIVIEVIDTLRKYFSFTNDEAYLWYKKIYTHATVVDTRSVITKCRDPDDNKFLVCAVDGKSDYLVSNDKDLLILESIFDIPIIKIGKFYNILVGAEAKS